MRNFSDHINANLSMCISKHMQAIKRFYPAQYTVCEDPREFSSHNARYFRPVDMCPFYDSSDELLTITLPDISE